MENGGEKIIKINIEEEMKSSYIDYSMSVIVSRALPDVKDYRCLVASTLGCPYRDSHGRLSRRNA